MPKGQTNAVLGTLVFLVIGIVAVVSIVNDRVEVMTNEDFIRNESITFNTNNTAVRVGAGDIRPGGLLSTGLRIQNATGVNMDTTTNFTVFTGNNSVALLFRNTTAPNPCTPGPDVCFVGAGTYRISYNYQNSDYLTNATQRTIVKQMPLGVVILLLVGVFMLAAASSRRIG